MTRLATHKYKWGGEGEIEIDRATHHVLRLDIHAIEIDPQSPVTEIQDSVSYGRTKIGDDEFLLPQRSESIVRTKNQRIKAETQFTDYRKFSSETAIQFQDNP